MSDRQQSTIPPPTDPLLTVPEVAARLRVSETTTRTLLYSGDLPSVRVSPNRRMVLHSELEAYIQRKREGAFTSAYPREAGYPKPLPKRVAG